MGNEGPDPVGGGGGSLPVRVTWLAINSSYSHSSLALPAIHAAGKDRTTTRWSRVQVTVKDQLSSIVAQVVAQQPDVLAATAYLFNRDVVLAVVRRVKALLPDCRVFLGGPEFLGDNREFLESERAVDAVLRGEGEEAFNQWLVHVNEPEAWGAIAGLCWRGVDGRICDNGGLAVVEDIQALPSPMTSDFYDWSRAFVQVETARGCFGRCTFCTSAAPVPVRTVELERVVDELERVREHGIQEVRLLDRTFNFSPRRAIELLTLFRTRFDDLRFHLEIHPGLLGDEVRAELRLAPRGLLHLEVGLQTTNVASLAACRRPEDIDAALDGLRFLCDSANLEVHVDLLAGLPEQDMGQLVDDLNLLSNLGPEEIQLEVLKVLPGTPLAEAAEDLKMVHAPDAPYEVMRTPAMSLEDLEAVRQLSQIVDAFYNQPDLQGVIRKALSGNPDFYEKFRSFLNNQGALAAPLALQRRFQLLHEFLLERDLDACDDLEMCWLVAGFSPQHGICETTLWKDDLPEGVKLAEGMMPTHRNVRIWQLHQRRGDCWVVFDRSTQQRRAAAVFRVPIQSTD